jgi:transcriptional regulator with XRE-family HTH domain
MPKKLREILATNLKSFRIREKLSQDEFAYKCGVHRTYIGSIERGERNVTLATLELLAEAMNIDVVTLLREGGVK